MATRYPRKRPRKKGRGKKSAHRDLKFVFDKNDQIGAADAEMDARFLESCFVDTGDASLLCDTFDHRRIILGRTGTGKSALLAEVRRRKGEHAIEISPDNLALSYVSNSTILSYLSALGVNLDPFFKLLWRHVLAVEVLSHHFEDHVDREEPGNKTIRQWLDGLVPRLFRKKQEGEEVVSYLKEWGADFWQETEYRVREITNKFEKQLTEEISASVGIDVAKISGSTGGSEAMSNEVRAELLERAQHVVSRAQIEDLRRIIPLLDALLTDKQKAYIVLIDGLDEEWVAEHLRYRLIKALILTVKEMSKIKNVKVVFTLRRDLLERVFRMTRGAGFQEEKYQSLYLPLNWAKSDLLEILDKRVEVLVHRKTGRAGVGFRQLMPKTVHGEEVGSYLFARANRPRDMIAFFNACIASAISQPRIKVNNLKVAEGEYSRLRLRALADEWVDNYPGLADATVVLQKLPPSFKISQIPFKSVEDSALALACNMSSGSGPIFQMASNFIDEVMDVRECRIQLVKIFYKVGLIGLKPKAFESESWVDSLGQGFPSADIDEDASVVVHPAYYRALGIRVRSSR